MNLLHDRPDLDAFDPQRRRDAVRALADDLHAGRAGPHPPRPWVNLHAHSFYSYNAWGWSPSGVVARCRMAGLEAAGLVDFDVLDGVDEFLEAGAMLDLPVSAGIESRVFVPEFAERVINSPGEPGIAYSMGAAMPSSAPGAEHTAILERLRGIPAERNRRILAAVNAYLDPVTLDFERDVRPLTPAGNATERHLCLAYARRAAALMPDDAALRAFWAAKLKTPAEKLDTPEGPALQGRIRAVTMKRGGVGYVQPSGGDFPTLEEFWRFVREAGGLPTIAWLDGSTDGERPMVEWFDLCASRGAVALNLILARNYTPGREDERAQLLRDTLAEAERRGWPVMAGTEMNSPENPFVDNYADPVLQPHVPVFRRGARILYAHTRLQRTAGLGLLSSWAAKQFTGRSERNDFYESVGLLLRPDDERALAGLDAGAEPCDILKRLVCPKT